jgi:hypothetical protein
MRVCSLGKSAYGFKKKKNYSCFIEKKIEKTLEENPSDSVDFFCVFFVGFYFKM